MRKWEEIFKDKLDEYESTLPEGSLSEFHARREGFPIRSGITGKGVRWGTVAAVAAGLAAVLLLRHPATQEDGVQTARQPEPSVSAVSEKTSVPESPVVAEAASVPELPVIEEGSESRPTNPVVVQAVTPKVTLQAAAESMDIVTEDTKAQGLETQGTLHDEPESAMPSVSPFAPQGKSVKTVKLKLGPVAGAIAGGGLLAAILTPAIVEINNMNLPVITKPISSISSSTGGNIDSGIEGSQTTPPGQPFEPIDTTNPQDQDKPADVLTGARSHKIPFRTGLSTRVPMSERLNLTTGLEYSRYESSFKYSISGDKTQVAHYLGVPVRLDWTLASSRWLDVYVGGGLEGDYCVGATIAGERINKDGLSFSLLGAGGIQLNVTDWLGVYVEPQLSYSFPHKHHVLETYRTIRPAMFTLSTGVRFNLGK